MDYIDTEIRLTGIIIEIKEKSKYTDMYSSNSDFIRFILRTSNEDIIVKFNGSNNRLKINTRVAVTGIPLSRDYYNNDNRGVIKASKIEIINPQKKLDIFTGVNKQ